MTRDDIIRMAQKASSESDYDFSNIFALERFAALVAAAEREACAKACEDLRAEVPLIGTTDSYSGEYWTEDAIVSVMAGGRGFAYGNVPIVPLLQSLTHPALKELITVLKPSAPEARMKHKLLTPYFCKHCGKVLMREGTKTW